MRQKSRNKHIVFWSYFSPLVIIFIIIIGLDFIAAAFYLVEFFLMWFDSKALLDVLEITNREVLTMEEDFAKISRDTRSLPSMIMFIATSKSLLLLTFNFAIVYVYVVASWKVCRENQKCVLKVTSLKKKDKKSEDSQQQPVHGSAIHRIENVATSPEISEIKSNKTRNSKEEYNKTTLHAKRDETELPTIHQVEIKTSVVPVLQLPKPTKNNKVEKVKKQIDNKYAGDAPRDLTELPEISFSRITYQKQPSQEEISLPPPPSFNNKRNKKTKF